MGGGHSLVIEKKIRFMTFRKSMRDAASLRRSLAAAWWTALTIPDTQRVTPTVHNTL